MSLQDARHKLMAGTALFGSLSAQDVAAIATHLRPTAFATGQLIFSRGDTGRDIYVVAEGRVRLSILSIDGRELSLIHAAAGDLFGEIAALDGGARSADATALGAVTGFVLPQAALKTLLESNPRISAAAIHFLCNRVRETNEKLEAIALHPIEVRLARFLLAAVRLQGAKGSVAKIDLAMSQSELALLIGASRPKVNIALTLLEDMGAITREGTKITCHIEQLETFAQADGP